MTTSTPASERFCRSAATTRATANQAGLARAADGAQALYASKHDAVLVTQDRELAQAERARL